MLSVPVDYNDEDISDDPTEQNKGNSAFVLLGQEELTPVYERMREMWKSINPFDSDT